MARVFFCVEATAEPPAGRPMPSQPPRPSVAASRSLPAWVAWACLTGLAALLTLLVFLLFHEAGFAWPGAALGAALGDYAPFQ